MKGRMGFRVYNLCVLKPFKIWMACISGEYHGQSRTKVNHLGDLDIGVPLRTNKIRVFTLSDYFTHSLSFTLLSSQQCATWNQLVWTFSVPWVALIHIFVDFRVNTPWIFLPIWLYSQCQTDFEMRSH